MSIRDPDHPSLGGGTPVHCCWHECDLTDAHIEGGFWLNQRSGFPPPPDWACTFEHLAMKWLDGYSG